MWIFDFDRAADVHVVPSRSAACHDVLVFALDAAHDALALTPTEASLGTCSVLVAVLFQIVLQDARFGPAVDVGDAAVLTVSSTGSAAGRCDAW